MWQNAVSITGQPRTIIDFPVRTDGKIQSVFQTDTKGLDKTATVYAGHVGGYRPVIRIKNVFNHAASSTPGLVWRTPSNVVPPVATPNIPISFYPPITPVYPPIPDVTTKVVVKPKPEKHIKEVVSFNSWQGNNPSSEEPIPMKPGTGIVSLVGEAPIGETIQDQALTKESIRLYPNVYFPRSATYVPKSITGTPTNLHSGLGITYDSSNPGSLIYIK